MKRAVKSGTINWCCSARNADAYSWGCGAFRESYIIMPAELETSFVDRHAEIERRISEACARAGRDRASVQLVAVTKTWPPEVVNEAIADGLRVLGENRVQEALAKAEGRSIILHQSTIVGTERLSAVLQGITPDTPVSFMIGPEGGFSDKECDEAVEKGLIPVLLATNILRAETAAIYTAAAIQAIMQN